jgi:hypothetical protein
MKLRLLQTPYAPEGETGNMNEWMSPLKTNRHFCLLPASCWFLDLFFDIEEGNDIFLRNSVSFLNGWHAIIPQKIELLITTAVRTSILQFVEVHSKNSVRNMRWKRTLRRHFQSENGETLIQLKPVMSVLVHNEPDGECGLFSKGLSRYRAIYSALLSIVYTWHEQDLVNCTITPSSHTLIQNRSSHQVSSVPVRAPLYS